MKNIFLIYIPRSNYEAMVHYEESIRTKVSPDRIYRHVNPELLGPWDVEPVDLVLTFRNYHNFTPRRLSVPLKSGHA